MKHSGFEHITDWSQINSQPYWCDLSHHQWLIIRGPDAATFLNGQATIKAIDQPNNTVQFGAFCNLKGRVIASFWSFHFTTEHIQLLLSPQMGDAMAEHLKKYALFSQVDLSVKAASGLTGSSTNMWGLDTPSVNTCHETSEQRWLAKLYPSAPFFLAQNLAPPSSELAPLPAQTWNSLLTANGLMMVDSNHCEQWLPQQLNYDLFGAINFEKGCYTGQEVVARLHYRGKTKDRLRSGIVTAQGEHALPEKITTKTNTNAGVILSSLPFSYDQSVVSGIIKTEMLDELKNDSSLGSILWLDPKYAIPDQ